MSEGNSSDVSGKVRIYGTVEIDEFEPWQKKFNEHYPNIELDFNRRYVYGTPPPMAKAVMEESSKCKTTADVVIASTSPILQFQNLGILEEHKLDDSLLSNYKHYNQYWVSVLAIPTVGFGISLAQFNNSFFGLHAWFIEYSQHHFNFLIAILSTLAALLGVFIAWVMIFRKFSEDHLMVITFKRIEHILIRQFFFDDFYQFVIDKIILIVANMVALFDRKLVNDILVDGLPKLVYSIGRIVRVFQSGQIGHYAFAMIFFASLIFAGWWLLVTNT